MFNKNKKCRVDNSEVITVQITIITTILSKNYPIIYYYPIIVIFQLTENIFALLVLNEFKFKLYLVANQFYFIIEKSS